MSKDKRKANNGFPFFFVTFTSINMRGGANMRKLDKNEKQALKTLIVKLIRFAGNLTDDEIGLLVALFSGKLSIEE